MTPWLDDDALRAGDKLERGIRRGFADSCAAVFFITPQFKDEGYLASEIEYAIEEHRKKGEKFKIIPIVFRGRGGETGRVPELLKPFVWKHPKTNLIGLLEILRALPIQVSEPRWRDSIAPVEGRGQ